MITNPIYDVNENLSITGFGAARYPQKPEENLTGKPFQWFRIVDVRNLLDEWNPLIEYAEAIMRVKYYSAIGKVLLGCAAGMSRSPAIAVGYLTYTGMDFYDAIKLVEEKNPITDILPTHISRLKKLLEVKEPISTFKAKLSDDE